MTSIFMHHIKELLVVNFAITVLIHTRQHNVNLFLSHCEVVALQTHSKLLATDSSAAIFIKVCESSLQMVFF